MKNRKGFTIVELLAVAIILVILSVITIPMVNKLTEKSKMNAFIKEANTFANAAGTKFFEDKTLSVKLRDDLFVGNQEGKVCYSVNDNLLNKYVRKTSKYGYSGSVEVCYAENCTYTYKLWLSDGHGFYINGKTKFDDPSIIEHSSSEQYLDSCGYETIGSHMGTENVAEFYYKGSEEVFTVLKDGTYALEAWGAQGGQKGLSTPGGYGAYAYAEVDLKKGDKLYINVGQQGTGLCKSNDDVDCRYSYNGGYKGSTTVPGGGGATHIAKKSGQIFDWMPKSDIYIVAAGGAGENSNGYVDSGDWYFNQSTKHGGAYCNWLDQYEHVICQGGDYGADAPGVYGQIGDGGGMYNPSDRRSGGQSYAHNDLDKNGALYCYKCYVDMNSVTTHKSYSTDRKSKDPVANYAKMGDGHARITLIDTNSMTYSLTYDLDGGALDSGKTNPSSYSITSNNITLNNPYKEGYRFVGWTYNDTTTLNTKEIIYRGSSGDRAYKANYEKLYDITYAYDLDEYTFPSGGTAINTGFYPNWDENFKIEMTANFPTSGLRYLLVGNYSLGNDLNLEIQADNRIRAYRGDTVGTSSSVITFGEDIDFTFTYHAKTRSFTFTAVGATTNASTSGRVSAEGIAGRSLLMFYDYRGGPPFNPYTVKSLKITTSVANTFALSSIPSNVTRPDATFNGWYTSQTGGSSVSSSTTVNASDVTYYAHWTANE